VMGKLPSLMHVDMATLFHDPSCILA
jgi:hypothetical protein